MRSRLVRPDPARAPGGIRSPESGTGVRSLRLPAPRLRQDLLATPRPLPGRGPQAQSAALMRGLDAILADPPARTLLLVAGGWLAALVCATYVAWRLPSHRPHASKSSH